MSDAMEYLTMTRIMENELKKWQEDKNVGWRTLTGMERVLVEGAFKQGFMAGFSGKYFGGNDD
jgi:hypothetical protein